MEELAAKKGKARLALYTYFGDAAPLFEEMLELPVDIIGLDFTYSPKLPAEVARRGCDKSIGLGLIDGRNTRIEKEEDVLKIVKRILPSIKGQTVYLNPSCGLGDFLPREIAFEKLRNIVAIAKKAEEMI
jgi:methionine synthase II (cobalamin-independent)